MKFDLSQLTRNKPQMKDTFKVGTSQYTVTMKTFNQFELFSLLTTTEGRVFGLLLHQLYENNRSNILDSKFKEYVFTSMGWDINSKTHKDRFVKVLAELDRKDLITRTEADRYTVNPFVQRIGGVDGFISETFAYYTTRANTKFNSNDKEQGVILEKFSTTYPAELEALVASINE